jgi:hypothetical protein
MTARTTRRLLRTAGGGLESQAAVHADLTFPFTFLPVM